MFRKWDIVADVSDLGFPGFPGIPGRSGNPGLGCLAGAGQRLAVHLWLGCNLFTASSTSCHSGPLSSLSHCPFFLCFPFPFGRVKKKSEIFLVSMCLFKVEKPNMKRKGHVSPEAESTFLGGCEACS